MLWGESTLLVLASPTTTDFGSVEFSLTYKPYDIVLINYAPIFLLLYGLIFENWFTYVVCS